MTNPPQSSPSSLERFLLIMAQLRNPQGGCPWDLKQTFETLKPLLVEEAYEASDAVAEGPDAIKEELGDMISLIGLFAQIGSEQKLFSFDSILDGISDKLVRRHPHVFGETKVSGTDEVLTNWEKIKQQERNARSESPKGLLDGIPRSLPSLLKAQQAGERCSRVGFDWSSREGVADKVREEVSEFLQETDQLMKSEKISGSIEQNGSAKEKIFEEFGDLLFTLAQYSRHLGFSAEEALQSATGKFIQRFQHLETLARERHPSVGLSELGSDTLETLWNESKKSLS